MELPIHALNFRITNVGLLMSDRIMNEDALPPSKGLFQERWEILKRNRLSYASFLFLIFLLVVAILGKVFTHYIVVFDPQVVRLSEKFLPPLTPFTSTLTPREDAPAFNIYFFGNR